MSPAEARRTRALALAALLAAALAARQAGRSGPRSWGEASPADAQSLRRLSAARPEARLEEARRAFEAVEPGGWRDAVASPGRLSPSVFAELSTRGNASSYAARDGALPRPVTRAAREAAREAGAPAAGEATQAYQAVPAERTEEPRARGKDEARPLLSHQEAGSSRSGGAARKRGRRQPPRARLAADDEEAAAAAAASQRAVRARRPRAVAASEERERSQAPARQPRRFRPIRLSKLWGRGSIRPPSSAVKAPDLSFLEGLKPKTLPGGEAVPPAAPPAAVEALEPEAPSCRRKDGHWHLAERLWHAGSAWGRAAPEGWAWLARVEGRWWGWTSPKDPAWLRWKDRWWWRKDGFWFLLHDGEPWGYRAAAGGYGSFYHAPTGTEMAYSRDGRYVAVVVPGQDALVFDAYTGAYLGTLDRRKLPPRPAPRAPATLRPVW